MNENKSLTEQVQKRTFIQQQLRNINSYNKYITYYYYPMEPEFAGSNPAEVVGFFGRPENPQYAFLRRGSKIICSMSQLCGM